MGARSTVPKCTNVDMHMDQFGALRDFALAHDVQLTVVGPEAPLVAGITEVFQAADLAIFGPSKMAAQLEGSKAFSKEFMLRHGIPTGQAEIFDDFDKAMRAMRLLDLPPVIKASGLAGGKGVLLPRSMEGAAEAVQAMLLDNRFGIAGATVLIEERMEGPELSVLAFCDGKDFRIMPPAQDHKRLLDRGQGPNTGGMGAFAPSPLATPELMREVAETHHPAHLGRHCRRGCALCGRALCGADVDRRRAQGAGIQLPLWRSGGPGHPAPVEE